jgi:hypothetical protein
MKVCIVYIYPSTFNGASDHYVARFLETYVRNPSRIDHQSIVVLNGGKQNSELACMFSPLKNLTFFEHDDSGWDIGAYQHAAREFDCDMMVFLGTSAWIKGPGWLDRMASAFMKHGDHLYGVMGNQGFGPVHAHIRTTGFWMSPGLLNEYPVIVSRLDQRYPFEHGQQCLTRFVWNKGKKVFVVTWNGEYEHPHWDSIPNGYHKGNQGALLIGDRLTDPPYYPIS